RQRMSWGDGRETQGWCTRFEEYERGERVGVGRARQALATGDRRADDRPAASIAGEDERGVIGEQAPAGEAAAHRRLAGAALAKEGVAAAGRIDEGGAVQDEPTDVRGGHGERDAQGAGDPERGEALAAW